MSMNETHYQNLVYHIAESNLRQEQSAQRQEELIAALIGGHDTQSAFKPSKIKAGKPEKYNGNAEKLHGFLLSLRLFFLADPVTTTTKPKLDWQQPIWKGMRRSGLII